MEDWKSLKIPKIEKIERLAAEFDVWSIELFPAAKVTVKIFEEPTGSYRGYPNMAAKKRQSGGTPDWITGDGASVLEALEITVKHLLESIIANEAKRSEDVEWENW